MILHDFLQKDVDKFCSIVAEWPPRIYSLQELIQNVRGIKNNSPALLSTLAALYSHNQEYEKALSIYLRLGRDEVFDFIQQHGLFAPVQDKVVTLMQFDLDKATALLVSCTDKIPVTHVVKQLQEYPHMLHRYLHQLFLKDPKLGQEYHERQVALYAKYDYDNLITFLKGSNYYSLEKAYTECEQLSLYPEMVFILGRMGNAKQALHLIIEKLANVSEAIEFVQTQNDDELWEDLITLCLNNQSLVPPLLEHIGAYVNPLKVVSRIPSGMKIPGLREKLRKIIQDYLLQMSLREGCNNILKADCVLLQRRLFNGQRRGQKVTNMTKCSICGLPVLGMMSRAQGGIVSFFCTHVYHTACITNACTGAEDFPTGGLEEQRLWSQNIELWCTLCESHSKTQRQKAGARQPSAVSSATPVVARQ